MIAEVEAEMEIGGVSDGTNLGKVGSGNEADLEAAEQIAANREAMIDATEK